MSEVKSTWAVSPNQRFSPNYLAIIAEFANLFRSELSIGNLQKSTSKTVTTYSVKSYIDIMRSVDVVIAKANLEQSWLSEKTTLISSGIQIVLFESLEQMIQNKKLDVPVTMTRKRKAEVDLSQASKEREDASSLSTSSISTSESAASTISARYSILMGQTEAIQIQPKARTNSKRGDKRFRSVSLTHFQKSIIFSIKEFVTKVGKSIKNNATNITTQNLLMLDYENSIVRTKYEFPFLTATKITDQVKNESKRLHLKENEDFNLAFLRDSLKSFNSINFKKRPSDLCFDIAAIFSNMGFKSAAVKYIYETKMFELTIKDYEHEEFHQDSPLLKDAFLKITDFYRDCINKRYHHHSRSS